MNTRDQLVAVIESQPELMRHGYSESPEEHAEFLATITDSDANFFASCCEWLSQCKQTKTIKKQEDSRSYVLKHKAVKPSGPHGLFIAAAIQMQIPYERVGRDIYLAIGSALPEPVA